MSVTLVISASGQKPLPCPTRVLLVLPCSSLSCFVGEKLNVHACAHSFIMHALHFTLYKFPHPCIHCPHRFGFCEVVISDEGREFVDQVETELLGLTGTQHHIATAYHTQTNGLVERFNQTLQSALLKVVNDTVRLGLPPPRNSVCLQNQHSEGYKV